MEVFFSVPWCKSYAKHLSELARKSGISLGHSHSQEIVAASAGFKSYAALIKENKDGAALSPPAQINWPVVHARVGHICVGLDADKQAAVANMVLDVFNAWLDPAYALARNLAQTCKNSDGSVFLKENEWTACGEIACREDFRDGLHTRLPFPTIAAIAQAKPDPDGEYQVIDEAVLNIIAFLRPNDWQDLRVNV